MASPLALLIQPAKNITQSPDSNKHPHAHLAEAIQDAFGSAPDPKTDIVHYVWVNVLPPKLTGGDQWFLVSVAYDLKFGPYIKNLLNAGHAKFDKLFALIEGGQAFVPVLKHLDAATDWVCSLDLNHGQTYAPVPEPAYCKGTNGGAVTGFFQRYNYTVIQIVPKS